MKVQAIAVGLVGLVIAVIFVGLVAVPVVDDATHGTPFEGTNTNQDGASSLFSYVTESPTLSWGRSSAGVVSLTYDGTTSTVNGETKDVLLVTDKFALRANSAGAQYWDYVNNTYTLSTDATIVVSLTITAGSYSLTFGETTASGTVSWAFFKDPNGDWARFSSGFKATLGQPVLMGNLFKVTGGVPVCSLSTVTNGTQGEYLIQPYNYSAGTIVSADASYEVEYSVVGEGQAVGLYSGMTTTYDGTEYDTMRFYAPLDFESTAVDNGGINETLLGIIPILLIIVAIMMAAKLIRND